MQINKFFSIVAVVILAMPLILFSNPFVVPKKTIKKMAVHVKEDIAELLESAVRQIGVNIREAISVQHGWFDAIKDMCGDKNYSTAQLQEMRAKLEKDLATLDNQAAQLHAMRKIF